MRQVKESSLSAWTIAKISKNPEDFDRLTNTHIICESYPFKKFTKVQYNKQFDVWVIPKNSEPLRLPPPPARVPSFKSWLNSNSPVGMSKTAYYNKFHEACGPVFNAKEVHEFMLSRYDYCNRKYCECEKS